MYKVSGTWYVVPGTPGIDTRTIEHTLSTDSITQQQYWPASCLFHQRGCFYPVETLIPH